MRAYEVSCTVFGRKTLGTSNAYVSMVFVAGLERAALQKHIDQAKWHLNHRWDHRRRANDSTFTSPLPTALPPLSSQENRTRSTAFARPSSHSRLKVAAMARAKAVLTAGPTEQGHQQSASRERSLPPPRDGELPGKVCSNGTCAWMLRAELDFWKPDELRSQVFDTVAGSKSPRSRRILAWGQLGAQSGN